MNNNKVIRSPDTAVWELTLKCNLKCLHCGSKAGNFRENEFTTKEALQLCNNLSEIGFQGIALMGGEVFLRSDWEAIAQEIKDQDMILSIITNGFSNHKKIIPKLTKIGVDSIIIGLDGATPETHDKIRGVKGSFKKAMDFVKAAKKEQLCTGIITTVHKLNFQELPKIRDIVLQEEVHWQVQEATPIGRFPKKLILSLKEYYSLALFILSTQKKYSTEKSSVIGAHNFGFNSKIIPNLSLYPQWNGCYAGKTVLGIQSNGDIKGCLALPDKFIEGNIRKRNIRDIWNDPECFTYNREFKIEDLGENCKHCKYGEACKGGCNTKSITLTNIPHNDPYCFHRLEKEGFI